MEVCESVGKSVIFVCEEAPKGLTMHFMTVEKSRKCCVVFTYLHFKDSAITSVKRHEKFSTRYVKGELKG